MEDLNTSMHSPSYDHIEFHSSPSSTSTSVTYQPDNHSPISTASSIKKEKIDTLTETKKTPSSHFLHDIIRIKQDEIQNEPDSVSESPFIPFQAFKTEKIFKPFPLNFGPTLFPLNQKTNIKNTPYIECVVCHDKSSGKHYGQYTCEGCKSFFKRSVRRNLTYQCRSSKNCPIDQYHRNQCQHCRFKKCLKMGMKKEAVQQGRNPSGQNMSKKNDLKTEQNNSFLSPKSTCVSEQKIGNNFTNNYLNQNMFNNANLDQVEENLCSFSSKFIDKIFEYNVSVPFFNSIKLGDQIGLLKMNWSELMFVTMAQSRVNFDTVEESSEEIEPSESNELKEQFVKTYKSQLLKLKSLSLDPEEFSYLKGILIYNSISDEFECKEMIENYQNVCHTCLRDVSNSKDREKFLRFGKILLALNSFWKEIDSSQVLRHFLSDLTEFELYEKIESNCKTYRSGQLNVFSENFYNLMSQNKFLNDQMMRPKPQTFLINNKLNEHLFKYQNTLLNSYFPVNYSNFLLNFRNPFLIQKQNSQSE